MQEQEALATVATRLNQHFCNNQTAYDVRDDLLKFPHPIGVDFNNVIANNKIPLKLNPDAPLFLEQLKEIGNIFIVTSAGNNFWEPIYSFFSEHNIWHPETVLMTLGSYSFVSKNGDWNHRGEKLRQEYFELTKNFEWSPQDVEGIKNEWWGYKFIAPLFQKPFRIPLIDNDPAYLYHNPGVLPVLVKEWVPEEEITEGWHKEHLERMNLTRPSLLEAVEVVKEYYSSLKP